MVWMRILTREEVVHSHAVFLSSVNGERQTVEVHSVILPTASYVQQMPSD